MDIGTFEKVKKQLAEEYFYNKSLRNNITKEFEDRLIEEYLQNGLISDLVVSWKAGRLIEDKDNPGDFVPAKNKNGDYYTGYGTSIDSEELENYLTTVEKRWIGLTSVEQEQFSEIYTKLVQDIFVPKNFGSVYIINLIYFLSKGRFPIYDKFAHKAAKALFMGKQPNKVYVENAPGINDIENVVNMYNEYLWLLEKLFHKYSIDRITDRALWVYGHGVNPSDT